ncbi:MAG: hydantoinase/oxoprolinase family protein [Faecousia sp.]
MKVRIGIDVGGTFTDAVAISNDTYEILGTVKVPTTHKDPRGVAAGIIQALHKVLEACSIDAEDVCFIAHGTTQATNALLEGDVAKVGIITIGSGLQGAKSKSDTKVDNIELAAGKYLYTENCFADAANTSEFDGQIRQALKELQGKQCQAFVAAEAFSVDKPENEERALTICSDAGLPATATNNISKLYGLRVRTRTAVINASILPKMLDAANMTEQSIKEAGIKSPLMIMRCDGGVMTAEEVRKRPILTTLSGPAAGVAGALMYEKLTDGLFFEVGGTSTDISCVKDGKVLVKYAEIGGHKTYLNSLDVRTVGIGGGSMVQISDGKAVNTGPRSAHIAGLEYEVYTQPENIQDPVLKTVSPKPGDPDYAYIECANGKSYALTLAGAANICGYVKEGDYAAGNPEAARKAWKPLADSMGVTVEEAAKKVMEFAANKNSAVAQSLIKDYNMDPRTTIFVGGGGGASTVVPHLAERMGHKFKIAQNAPVISTIGVALAMVRDMVERTILNPTEQEILEVRREAELLVIQAGANPESIEISIEVDNQRNIVRATAIGTTELRTKNLLERRLTEDELVQIVAENLDVPKEKIYFSGRTDSMYAAQYEHVERTLFLFKKKATPLRLIDEEGVIRLQKRDGHVIETEASGYRNAMKKFFNEHTIYDDRGHQLPNMYIVLGKKIIDLSGLVEESQALGIARTELAAAKPDEKILVICSHPQD